MSAYTYSLVWNIFLVTAALVGTLGYGKPLCLLLLLGAAFPK